jgi:DNA primase
MSVNQDSGYQAVTPEDFLEHEGIEYRATSGSRGPQFNIKECPKCGTDKWKVYLSRDNGWGNCFTGSCEARFNLWTFAAAHLGTEDGATIGKLFDEIAKGVGWKPKQREKKAPVPVFDGDLKLPTSVPAGSAGIPYLTDRGFSPRIQQELGLRMCHDGAFRFKREDGSDGRMVFSGRVIIPIYDTSGKLVTFQGRDTTGEKDPKYLFPPRLPSTARYLYNGHRARAERWSHIVMGEGALDTAAIQEAIYGDRTLVGMGAVGSFGKNLTLDFEPGMDTQLQALIDLRNHGLKVITILWDGETKALISALKTARKLVGYGFAVRIGFLPKGKDPAECQAATVRKAIQTALPYSKSLEVKVRLKNPYGRA